MSKNVRELDLGENKNISQPTFSRCCIMLLSMYIHMYVYKRVVGYAPHLYLCICNNNEPGSYFFSFNARNFFPSGTFIRDLHNYYKYRWRQFNIQLLYYTYGHLGVFLSALALKKTMEW